jgi:pimeloyl-ACP methyl ester carboxylesterase
MLVVFVHGWGVRKPDYGALPQRLRSLEIWLSDYVTYDNDVTMDDLVQAFERARLANFPQAKFACVTHSTGGPVVRAWAAAYGGEGVCPLTHLVMLAPPNHGCALAQLGKSRLSRMHFWLHGSEPGQKILDWLELGSAQSQAMNRAPTPGVFQFVLAGASIDKKFYDHLNSYTGEAGSDGVVRAAAANLNFTALRLEHKVDGSLAVQSANRPAATAFGILPAVSHTGARMGILHNAAAAEWVDRCLRVMDENDYRHLAAELAALTPVKGKSCSMIVFRVIDSSGAPVEDYDLLLTSGAGYSPERLPKGFFIDRQRNSRSTNVLTYYVNHTAMARARELGFRIVARPASGPVSYAAAEFRSDLARVEAVIRPHETTFIDVTLRRQLEERIFRCSPHQGKAG